MANVKDGLLYNKSHIWAKIEDDKVTIGLSDYAQEQLGDISMVDLNYSGIVGTKVEQAKYSGNDPSSDPVPDISVESSKAVGDIFAPVSGEVVEVNKKLEDSPELVNTDCYGNGWLLKIKASALGAEKGNIMDAAAYKKFLSTL
ncbi:MAG: glycine cleavage system H protein [Promethearchaeota archaeon CR_4]|nr:MAG: glycine cleavage system H protein [Candidatus Lokiarchaeota archaeon CR_4]